jgi:hypothetical protein
MVGLAAGLHNSSTASNIGVGGCGGVQQRVSSSSNNNNNNNNGNSSSHNVHKHGHNQNHNGSSSMMYEVQGGGTGAGVNGLFDFCKRPSSSTLVSPLHQQQQQLGAHAGGGGAAGAGAAAAAAGGCGSSKGAGAGEPRGINHFATERQRREYLNEKYQTLRSLVPNPTKVSVRQS